MLIEHSDFECPFCESFQRVTLPVLKQEYLDAGTVVLAYRHMPLPTLHPRAVKAAEAAACAARQGRFWEMHDALFENQRALDDEALEGHAARAGVDLETWRACVAEGLTSAEVAVEAAEAARLGLTGTPAFLVGVRQPDGSVRVLRVISGAKPLEEFREALDEALAVNAVDEAAR